MVSRTRGSSSIATCATTYGAGSPGRLNRSLTVNPINVAYPETADGAKDRPRQYRHTGAGGWMSAEQAWHRWNRSRPSAPEVQKNVFSGVSSGRGRPACSVTSSVGGSVTH